MMRRASCFMAAALLTLLVQAQTDSISQRIFLIGDAGELVGDTHPVVDWLQKNVNWNDALNTAIFLGDNIYPLGLPMEGEPDYPQAKKIIDYQLSLVKGKKGRAYFIPGNHDWANGKLNGWQRVRNQHDYINGLEQKNIKSLPTEGCPGPVSEDLNSQITVVFIDSQWFMYVHDKPGPGSSCNARTIDEFETELKEIAADHPNQLLLVVTHHPLYSFGVHGGDYTWKEHLFPLTALSSKLWIPLPVLGSIYPISRGVFGNLQDVKHPLYQGMVKTIQKALKGHPNVITAAGHDHSLQLILKDSVYHIVSGSGSNLSRVKENREGQLLFQDLNYGFSMIEVTKSGKVTTKFYNINDKSLETPNFVQAMKPIVNAPIVPNNDTTPIFGDSVLIAANKRLRESGVRNLFLGKNYRQEWTTPIKVPILDLGTEQGGLTPEKQGGGKQTKSLRVKTKDGKEWVLRSVEKYPDAAIPPDLRQTFVKDIVEDGISAAYPFAGLSTVSFSQSAGIPHLKRRLVYIPDDPRLGRFRSTFSNTLASLEEREPEGVNKTYNTDEVVLRLAKDNDDHVDQVSLLKARLLDNFYMDFDRHEDQWRWATKDTGKGKIYYAIPKDQDQAFFTNQGILPYFVKSPALVPEFQGFGVKADNIKTFNKPARNFDRFFLTELPKEVWEKQVDSFLLLMTDEAIEKAMNQQPREVRDIHFNEIVNTLKKRRKHFKKEMLEYYSFISKEVNIVGTNQRELFIVDKLPGNKVHVTLNKIDKNNAISSKIYDRVFDKEDTKELRLYGLDDNDSFVVRGVRTSMRIRIIGGPGHDYFVGESAEGRRTSVYDVSFEESTFSGNAATFKQKITADPRNNEYNRIFYKYGYFIPGVTASYNADDGLFLGLRGELVKHGFRKDPFQSRHVMRIGHALRTSSYYFRYDGDFTKPFNSLNNDLLIRADVRAPVNVTNFFGIGNSTNINRNQPEGIEYYRIRYNIADVSVLLRRRLQSWMRVNYGPSFQYFHLSQRANVDKFVGNSVLTGVDPTILYDRKLYAGAEGLIDINSKNNQNIPTRGFILDAGVRSLFGLNNKSNNVTQLHWDMSVFASLSGLDDFVLGMRLGVGHNIGAYEIPQAQYLSGTDNLRGFRRNRFAGRTMFFQNTELRIKVTDFTTFLFPGTLGLLVFNDVGRVWVPEEKSGRWHDGYGAGFYIAPIQRVVLTVAAAHSNEEKLLPYFGLGFRF